MKPGFHPKHHPKEDQDEARPSICDRRGQPPSAGARRVGPGLPDRAGASAGGAQRARADRKRQVQRPRGARRGGQVMGTTKDPGEFDCYANAAPDEPMFVLLGRDPVASILVRRWADLRYELGLMESTAKMAEARRCADAMEAWCCKLGRAQDEIGRAS